MPRTGTANPANANTWNADTPPSLHILGYGPDPGALLAERLLDHCAALLPDLSGAIVLVPERAAAPRLRQQLLAGAQQRGHPALLGPTVTTLQEWVAQYPLDEGEVVGPYTPELLLVEALQAHPQLYGTGNPWTLADSLLELFNAMTAHQVRLPDGLDDFVTALGEAYGTTDTSLSALGREAKLVHTLWQAYHTQLHALGAVDAPSTHLLRLASCLQHLTAGQAVFLIGNHGATPAEMAVVRALIERRQLTAFITGGTAAEATPYDIASPWHDLPAAHIHTQPTGTVDVWLDAAFDTRGATLHTRATQTAARFPASPLIDTHTLLGADSAEAEAIAVDIQIRRWLWEGKQRIGVITDNRRLARRLRALLERADIVLDDSAGWALSTTSAAAALERWLQTAEEDFPYQPLLDLMRSPFFAAGAARAEILEASYRLEQDIVRQEGAARGLDSYRRHIAFRLHRLPPELAPNYTVLQQLLTRLNTAATPLRALMDNRRHPAPTLLDGLRQSLGLLGMEDTLNNDAAGCRILQELDRLNDATHGTSLPLTWPEFRTWLGRTLERFNFQPTGQHSPVQLLSLRQTAMARFDAVVIAGAEHEYLPGAGNPSPFFNDGVRARLGLPTRLHALSERYRQFRTALQCAPRVLITHRREENGEDIIPTPWLAQLREFHRLAYGHDLHDTALAALIADPRAQIVRRTTHLPSPMAPQPRARVPAARVPLTWSAHAYQQLMDCPYQFFAARCLHLAPPEAVREALQKSDYGERVHRCLEAFHHRIAGLPGPFGQPVNPSNYHAAVAHMERIAKAVFANDLEDNFQHRGWYKRWQQLIPAYVDWEMQRALDWCVLDVELAINSADAPPALRMQGRIDRVDSGPQGLGILDYKTGTSPREREVLSGEAVQLPYYTLITRAAQKTPIQQAAYVAVGDKGRVETAVTLEGAELNALAEAVDGRLQTLVGALRTGAELPAWGDPTTCNYCNMEGVCRKQTWRLEAGGEN